MPSTSSSPPAPFFVTTTSNGSRVARYSVGLEQIPADFFADPDGAWTFEGLADSAGFSCDAGVAVGALRESWGTHPAGSAIVTLNSATRPYVAVIECPIAFTCSSDEALRSASAA